MTMVRGEEFFTQVHFFVTVLYQNVLTVEKIHYIIA